MALPDASISAETVERRRNRRFDSSGLALYGTLQRRRQCRLLDVSERGLRISADHVPPAPGSKLLLTLVGGHVCKPVGARVIWSTFGQFGVALIDPLTPEIVAQLHRS
jgi:hypothetical protein